MALPKLSNDRPIYENKSAGYLSFRGPNQGIIIRNAIKNHSKIEEKMGKIKNIELKSSLNNFLKAFDERKK